MMRLTGILSRLRYVQDSASAQSVAATYAPLASVTEHVHVFTSHRTSDNHDPDLSSGGIFQSAADEERTINHCSRFSDLIDILITMSTRMCQG